MRRTSGSPANPEQAAGRAVTAACIFPVQLRSTAFALTAGLYPALAALFGRVHRGLADPGAA